MDIKRLSTSDGVRWRVSKAQPEENLLDFVKRSEAWLWIERQRGYHMAVYLIYLDGELVWPVERKPVQRASLEVLSCLRSRNVG